MAGVRSSGGIGVHIVQVFESTRARLPDPFKDLYYPH
jgi:hypothetical protein